MNKSIVPLLLIILAIGTYFTFTRVKIDEVNAIKDVNAVYQKALDNSEKLIKVRDEVLASYNKLDIADRENLEKLLPDNIDNVRLIIDTNAVAARYGLVLKNIKTNSLYMPGTSNSPDKGPNPGVVQDDSFTNQVPYNTMSLSFNVTISYESFIRFIQDLEASLRIMDISKLTLSVSDTGGFEYSVEIKTYWLKQK